MTASEYAKSAGLPNLEYVASMINKPPQTLRNWQRNNPALFKVVVAGCAHIRATSRPADIEAG